jgi:hypothetical protein
MLTCLSQQVLIKGNISDKITGEKIRSATVRIKNGNTVLSDSLGHFEIKANGPVMLTVTHASYEPIELNIAAGHEWVEINLVPNAVMLNAVVLSTKGIPTRILDAPFSAELIDYKQITQLPATSAYNGQAFKKGIDMTTSSLTFNTPSTRGFNGSGSTRVNQLID